MRLSNPEEKAMRKMACLDLRSRKSSNIINTYGFDTVCCLCSLVYAECLA